MRDIYKIILEVFKIRTTIQDILDKTIMELPEGILILETLGNQTM